MIQSIVFGIVLFIGGYLVSIYSWDWLRTKLQGIEVELIYARDKVAQLETKIKSIKVTKP